MTALIAFLIGGLVVLATTGKDPLNTYKAIFKGTGLSWLSPVSIHWHLFYPAWDPLDRMGHNLADRAELAADADRRHAR